MSLIYRALKSLQASRGKGGPGAAGPRPEKRSRSRIQQLRHRFVSPGAVMITAGLLILAGIGMVLGMEWLLERSRLVAPQVVSQQSVHEAATPPRERAGDTPTAPRGPPPTGPRRDDPVPPPPPPFEAPPSPPPDLTVTPAATVAAASGRPAPGAITGGGPVFVPPPEPAAEVAFIAPPATDGDRPEPSAPAPRVDTQDLPPAAAGPPVLVDTAREAPAPADPRRPLPEGSGTASPDRAYHMARTPAGAGTPGTPTPKAPETSPGGTSGDVPGVSLKVQRQAELAVTARKLQGAMAAGNAPEVEALLLRLGDLQGEDNPFLLKMRAYWHLQNQRYARSEAILRGFLKRMPGDLDAQLNMAVVEAHTGRREAASARLAELARRFPGEARVAAMARLLN